MINVKLGQELHITSKKKYVNGSFEIQEFWAIVTYVDDRRFEYEVTKRVKMENVSRVINKGGFSKDIDITKWIGEIYKIELY